MYKREIDWLQGIGYTIAEADFKAGWRPREELMSQLESKAAWGTIPSSSGISVFFS